jgi:hypothetical protein
MVRLRKQAPIAIDSENCALLIVDVQRYFAISFGLPSQYARVISLSGLQATRLACLYRKAVWPDKYGIDGDLVKALEFMLAELGYQHNGVALTSVKPGYRKDASLFVA